MEVMTQSDLEKSLAELKGQLEETAVSYQKTLETFLNADAIVKRGVELKLNMEKCKFFELKEKIEAVERMLAVVAEADVLETLDELD